MVLSSRKSKRSTSSFVSGHDKNGRRSEDSVSYERPRKLPVPCARAEYEGHFFQVDRVLDTISVVSSDRILQSMVQWKPTWLKLMQTSSTVRDFYSRVTVIGCVVKDNILRSRVSQKTKWSRKEFKCLRFRIRVDHSDGSSTYEVVPYPDLKARFPAALFEYFEKRMPSPDVSTSDEPRRDGLLSIYNNITVPRYLDVRFTRSKRSVLGASSQKLLNCSASWLANDTDGSV
ncbi:hypothetical protein KIN20_017115 [Parelaphostrongylus tenuis]|uniref:Uncharacterized protein n=1 Tax=Parelaphostrongylus tenuis TaxID=148309 RepID=A0AAD5MMR7_PARTN|nr:hypothetical protein KIN20_017115 [Parelaphostrongylus tenuis]